MIKKILLLGLVLFLVILFIIAIIIGNVPGASFSKLFDQLMGKQAPAVSTSQPVNTLESSTPNYCFNYSLTNSATNETIFSNLGSETIITYKDSIIYSPNDGTTII